MSAADILHMSNTGEKVTVKWGGS